MVRIPAQEIGPCRRAHNIADGLLDTSRELSLLGQDNVDRRCGHMVLRLDVDYRRPHPHEFVDHLLAEQFLVCFLS